MPKDISYQPPLIWKQLTPQNDDEKFMIEALKEAEKAYSIGEVPVGAVLVHEGNIIARGHNQVELLRDATAHAEMLCLTSGAVALENWRLLNTILYSTLEPCIMCVGALMLSRVPKIVWAAPDIRHGAGGSWINVFDYPHPTHSVEVVKGIYEQESAFLMRDFFSKRREL